MSGCWHTERPRQTLLKLATLSVVKTLEQYDFGFASGAPRSQLQALASLTFIKRPENIVLPGPSGVGEKPPSHRSSLSRSDGWHQDTVLFITAVDLML